MPKRKRAAEGRRRERAEVAASYEAMRRDPRVLQGRRLQEEAAWQEREAGCGCC